MKGDLDIDPRGLLHEAYRIDGIGGADCRTIFLDWALGLPAGQDPAQAVRQAHAHYAPAHPDHPMTRVLAEGLAPAPGRRRGGRAGRGR
ncbi:hypothetical protein GE300_10310 [Rhodobacteraceae bacterium 2CG4]|uniref:Uncharacterized protein n=1 Tax=Halovulum marinum TaxID=2662447 RepID=A0A6L5Z1N8_9RHOB|nr:hypothetical protein [Halovulum marinum]MSU90002.1 hypothetical protein [Halovulum marinum]